MFRTSTLACAVALTLSVVACGLTPSQVNEAGHSPYRSGDYAAALDTYENAGELAADKGEPRYNAGNTLYRMELYDQSVVYYDESLRYARGQVRTRGLFNRGNAAYRMESYAEAAEAYTEVLRIDPDDLDAKHNLELALKQMPPEDDPPPPEDDPPPPEEDESSPPPQSEAPPPPPQPQDEPMTAEQARQLLEAVGEDAQTLQERREQSLVSANPQTEFDW